MSAWLINETLTNTTTSGKVDLGLMAIKMPSIFLKAPVIEPPHQMHFRVIYQDYLSGESYPSVEMELGHFTFPADSAKCILNIVKQFHSRVPSLNL